VRVALLLLVCCAAAHAQSVPVPSVPDVPDEPLPEWKPPTRKVASLHLQLTPQMIEAQKLRQAGVWISSIGWVQVFVGGIVYVAAVLTNSKASTRRAVGYDPVTMMIITSNVFDPSLEDQRNQLQSAAFTLFIAGATEAAGGFVLYTVGQARLSIAHKAHPKDPLPPLSGY
jgi:hypothetical protein